MGRDCRVLVMPGEGVGPEVTAVGVRVLRAVGEAFGLHVDLQEFEVGAPAMARFGQPLPADAETACRAAEAEGRGAILFGVVVDEPICILRKTFDLYMNLRPVRMHPALVPVSRLRPAYAEGIDLLIVRELVSGLYYGRRHVGRDESGRWASQELFYGEREIERITRVAFEQARRRRRRLTLVHKVNAVPDVFSLWLSVVGALAGEYPEVVIEDLLVDNMAMQMVLRPADFDVILASNLFGDILSDLGAGLLGSVGVLPSASLNERGFALYEPVGGTAPDIAGQNVANPIASVLSVAMMLRYSFDLEEAAVLVEKAVDDVLEHHRTPDIWTEGCKRVSTADMGDLLTARLRRLAEVAADAAPVDGRGDVRPGDGGARSGS